MHDLINFWIEIVGLDGKIALVKSFNFEENVPKVYHHSVQHLFHRFSFSCNLMQDTLSVSLTNYPANFMEIDGIDAEHCDGFTSFILLRSVVALLELANSFNDMRDPISTLSHSTSYHQLSSQMPYQSLVLRYYRSVPFVLSLVLYSPFELLRGHVGRLYKRLAFTKRFQEKLSIKL